MYTKCYPTQITPITPIIPGVIIVDTEYPAPTTLHRLQNHVKMHTNERHSYGIT